MTTVEAEIRVGPSDREFVEGLQRMASARAHLVHAGREASSARQAVDVDDERNRSLEDAHRDVLWAQAGLLSNPRSAKAQKASDIAEARLTALLMRYGFTSFAEYRAERTAVPTIDVHLALARREYASALAAWQELQLACIPTAILDLTGDEPRVIS